MKRQRVPQGKWRLRDYLRNYRFNSIFLRNLSIITLLITLPLLVINYGYSMSAQQAMQQEIFGMEQQNLYRNADVMDALLKEVYDLAYSFSTDADTRYFMLLGEPTLEESIASGGPRNTLVSDLYERIRFFTTTYRYIDSIYLYATASQLVLCNGNLVPIHEMRDDTWIPAYQQMNDRSFCIEARRKNDSYPYYISFICPAKYLAGGLSGAVIINLNIEALGNIINGKAKQDGTMYITDRDGRILYDNDYHQMETSRVLPQALTTLGDTPQVLRLDGQETVAVSVVSKVEGLRYISLRPMSHYESQQAQPLALTLRMALISLLLNLGVTFVITRVTFSPVRDLLIAADRPLALERSNGTDTDRQATEVEHIKDILYAARSTSAHLRLELEERMNKLNNAQLRALQNQINPHFLYNTLDAIRWAAIDRLGGENEISNMITPLARLMQVSLECKRYLVSIREEIEHVKLYLQIFDIRYHERIHVNWALDEGLMDVQIIKLSMQPLVENAIHHGLRPKHYHGCMTISGTIKEGQVCLSVADDGVGMEIEQVEQLNHHMQEEYLLDDRYVGLRNVNQRFKLLYGERAGVQLLLLPAGGLCARLVFPAKTEA